MAEYLIIPKRLARSVPALGRAAQWLEAQAFRFIFWFVDLLSPERANKLGAFAFGLLGPRTAKAKKADINLSIAFPEHSAEWRRRTVREIFRSLGESTVELVKLGQIWEEREQRLQFDFAEEARTAMESGRAIIFVSAHVGPWQLTNLLSLHCGLQVSTVYAPESNPAIHAELQKLREAFGVKLVATREGVRPLLRELQQGHCIGLAMDTRLDTGQLIPFFGRDALTNTSAARLALRTGAAIVPVRAQRQGQARYRITAYPPIESRDPQASTDEQSTDISEQINQVFEGWIRENPEQWICLKRRWPKAHRL